MTTGDRIRQARIQAGMTQKELAEKIGVKFSAISKYETGRVKNLKREDIDILARTLNVKPSWLMCMDDDSNLPARQEMRTEKSSIKSRKAAKTGGFCNLKIFQYLRQFNI